MKVGLVLRATDGAASNGAADGAASGAADGAASDDAANGGLTEVTTEDLSACRPAEVDPATAAKMDSIKYICSSNPEQAGTFTPCADLQS